MDYNEYLSNIMYNGEELLKSIISNIVIRNIDLCEYVQHSNRGNFCICIKDENFTHASQHNHYIYIEIDDIIGLIDFCEKYTNNYKRPRAYLSLSDLKPTAIESIVVLSEIRNREILNSQDFSDNITNPFFDCLFINALSAVILHETGHILNDKDSMFQIEKEIVADYYLFKQIKKKCDEKNDNISSSDPFMGTFLLFLYILNKSRYESLEIDYSHPHPVERIYRLFEYFNIEDNSELWENVNKEIQKWLQKNGITESFRKNHSTSPKELFIDAYLRFKK